MVGMVDVVDLGDMVVGDGVVLKVVVVAMVDMDVFVAVVYVFAGLLGDDVVSVICLDVVVAVVFVNVVAAVVGVVVEVGVVDMVVLVVEVVVVGVVAGG